MKESSKKVFVLAFALVFVLSLALVGCSDNKPAATPPASETPATNTPAANTPAATPETPAAAKIAVEWQGNWYSKSEIVPPEQETDQYSLEVAEDGSFKLLDGTTKLYAGTLTVTDKPEAGWGEVVIDGTTIKVQLVNAQGVYKLIFNAGDDWNHDLKKIVFQR